MRVLAVLGYCSVIGCASFAQESIVAPGVGSTAGLVLFYAAVRARVKRSPRAASS